MAPSLVPFFNGKVLHSKFYIASNTIVTMKKQIAQCFITYR